MSEFTHLNGQGQACMVDVGEKSITKREATACGRIYMSAECFDKVKRQEMEKGDVLAVARVAGIMGAKKTSELIPLCHPLPLTRVELNVTPEPEKCAVFVQCIAKCTGQTGVEMEALTGASVALLTVYDMCKAVDKRMRIEEVHLVEKSGGKSGDFRYDLP